ncbi:beta-galactosidase [Pseudoduganella lurida]|uniref:Beta-galactosidase n=2 Tax=Pseudoduganella lurida TaxID=1036180 RepID=A0A562REC6_9BURK|nr:beta-galactosidase [Pseudoduganella lurida]
MLLATLAALLPATVAAQVRMPDHERAQLAPRERLLINDGWRFTSGDPADAGERLAYDLRPVVKYSEDGKAADAEPVAPERLAAAGHSVLKPWILPTGNAFIADPSKRHVRPAGHPGSDVSYVQPAFDDRAWRQVDLPHDWAIEGPFLPEGPYGGMGRLKSWGPVWYRKALAIPAADKGKSLFLDVDGAMSYATVWLNGKLVGGWPYGYTSWRVDLTPYANPGGRNQLVIRLDNPGESARWYPGSGIYRNVWLTKTQPVHVGQWGTVITTPQVSKAAAQVRLAVTVDNAGSDAAAVDVGTDIYALDDAGARTGGIVARTARARLAVPAGGSSVTQAAVTIDKPRLWGPPPTQQPHRYLAVTTVYRDGRAVDRYETRFGVRSLRLDANEGLSVNGERLPIRGINAHQDLGALGTAWNYRAAERQLEILAGMGVNALRMSHYPHAPELMELADRMGFLVFDEVFDAWERRKTPLDFSLVFPDWHEQDLRSLIRRDRNHPSVMAWSVGNEVGEQYTGKDGAAIGAKLVAIAHAEDPTRLASSGMNFAKPEMALPATLDFISLNYQGEGIRQDPEFEGTDRIRTPPQFPRFHDRFPDKPVLSSESASAFSSRGVYLFPVTRANSSITRDGRGGDSVNHQVSAYELYAVDFGSSADKVFGSLDQHPFVAGEFVWTGFDYLGEPTPYYTSRSAYTGIVDLAGFPKDRYYLYQSRWRAGLPMAHILPHWTWPERQGEVTPVHVFTSADEGELFVNGQSQGRRKKGPSEYRLRWDDVVYAPGEVSVVTYRDGKEWARDRVVTAGAAARLDLSADRTAIRNDGSDLSFVTVRVVDDQGNLAPRANQRVRFEVTGPGEIVATDNGDPTDLEAFKAPERRAFNGLALAIVRFKPGQAGTVTVRASADGLKSGTATLQAAPVRK